MSLEDFIGWYIDRAMSRKAKTRLMLMLLTPAMLVAAFLYVVKQGMPD